MDLRGTCKGRRRVTLAAKENVSSFSSTTGVVMGRSHAIERTWSPNPDRPRSGWPNALVYLSGEASACGVPGAAKQNRFLKTQVLRHTPRVDVNTAYTYHPLLNVREVPVRCTKTWPRFNPGRCHDCDLRFSFLPCSRTLPFLSHDARVEMGRPVMPD